MSRSFDRFCRWRREGSTAIGVQISRCTCRAAELYGKLGFEWLLLDDRTTVPDAQTCRELVQTADLLGLPCVIRVPDLQTALAECYLEVGALGLLAPNVSSAEQAARLVELADATVGEKHDRTERAFSVALIESRAGLERIESIGAVRGLDCLGIDAGLLLARAGAPRNLAEPQLTELIFGTRIALSLQGKQLLILAQSVPQVRAARSAGVKLVAVWDAVLS